MSKQTIQSQFEAHIEVARSSAALLEPSIAQTADLIVQALASGKKLLAFGNGGSAGQADHLAAELIGRYRKTRSPYPALSLASSPGTLTCIANDFSYGDLFERQVHALATEGDVVVGLTTSGSSENVLRGLKAGREKGAKTILLTGAGITDAPADHILGVPSASTARIQEVHLLIIHAWCERIDEQL
jgi:D-sedoheptulose 7-phosphate isomerase